jgi:vitamin B12 transporter
MRNRPLCFVQDCPGSTRVSRVGFGVSPKQSFEKSAIARRNRQHARRVRYPERWRASLPGLLLLSFASALWAQEAVRSTIADPDEAEAEAVVVSATRFDIPLDQSPASASVITAEDIEAKQIERVSDALRQVPGLSVVQTGTAGQLTSVFTRGLNSAHTQVLLDGIPINQGLAAQFDFANLTTDNIARIEIVRGPQSTLYGPRAMAGVIQLFTKQGDGTPGITLSSEGGSYGTFRESLQSAGSTTLSSGSEIQKFDYSIGLSRIDTDNARPNNQYRNTAGIANIGYSPNEQLRISTLFVYANSDAGSPNMISTPRPLDNLLTEKWLVAPHVDLHIGDWWDHKFILSYDHERQLNDPYEDGFVGPTRALFERTTIDYQNDLRPTSWLTLTSGFFYSRVNAGQERPFILFGPTFISDHTEETAGFLEATAKVENLILVAGGRYDHFNQFGDIWTYRFAGSYKIDQTDTTLHASVATGFSPPSSQDKIFRFNQSDPLEPEEDLGWDVGVEQRFWEKRITIGAIYFHSDLSNLIGFNGLFETFNLGSARTQGIETEVRATPMTDLVLTATYTYLDTEKTSSADINQPQGARLPRRPRNEVYLSASYLWFKKLRTTLEAKWVNAREELKFGAPNFDIEDYNFVNFAAEYEVNPHLSIFGRIDNLTNEHYSEVFGFPNLGRAAYGGVKIRF